MLHLPTMSRGVPTKAAARPSRRSAGASPAHAESGGPRAGRPSSPGAPLPPHDRTGTAGTPGPGHAGAGPGAAGARAVAATHGGDGAPYARGCPGAQRPQRRCRRRWTGGTPSAPGSRPGTCGELGPLFRLEERVVTFAARRLPVVPGDARRTDVHNFRSLPGAACGQRAAWMPEEHWSDMGGPAFSGRAVRFTATGRVQPRAHQPGRAQHARVAGGERAAPARPSPAYGKPSRLPPTLRGLPRTIQRAGGFPSGCCVDPGQAAEVEAVAGAGDGDVGEAGFGVVDGAG